MQTKLDEWYERVKAAGFAGRVSLRGNVVVLHRKLIYKILMVLLAIVCGAIGWIVLQYEDGAYFFVLAIFLSAISFMIMLGVFKVQKIDVSTGDFKLALLGINYKQMKLTDYIAFGSNTGTRYGMSMHHSKVLFAKGLGTQVSSFGTEKSRDKYNNLLADLIRIGRKNLEEKTQ